MTLLRADAVNTKDHPGIVATPEKIGACWSRTTGRLTFSRVQSSHSDQHPRRPRVSDPIVVGVVWCPRINGLADRWCNTEYECEHSTRTATLVPGSRAALLTEVGRAADELSAAEEDWWAALNREPSVMPSTLSVDEKRAEYNKMRAALRAAKEAADG